MANRKPNTRPRNLADVLDQVGLAELRPTDVRIWTGDVLLSLIARVYHLGRDIGVADAEDAARRNR